MVGASFYGIRSIKSSVNIMLNEIKIPKNDALIRI